MLKIFLGLISLNLLADQRCNAAYDYSGTGKTQPLGMAMIIGYNSKTNPGKMQKRSRHNEACRISQRVDVLRHFRAVRITVKDCENADENRTRQDGQPDRGGDQQAQDQQ